MAIVVLLILVVVWAVVLGPGFLRRRFERRSADSIGEFHHHLRVLQRAAPPTHPPAFRLAGASPHGAAPGDLRFDVADDVSAYAFSPDASDGAVAMGPAASRGVARSLPRAPGGARPDLTLVRSPRPGMPMVGDRARSHADPFFRPAACRRRRDVLLWLVCAVLATGLLGALPHLRMALAVTAVAAVVTVLYVVLLVRMRARAVERIHKLRYLPAPTESRSSFVIRQRAAR